MAEPEKVTLPSGGWALFRDPRSLTVGDRRPVKAAQARLGFARNIQAVLNGEGSAAELSDDDVLIMQALPEAIIVALVQEWSFDQPVSRVGLRALTDERDFDKLIEEAEKVKPILLPDFAQTGDHADAEGRENPTGPSPA